MLHVHVHVVTCCTCCACCCCCAHATCTCTCTCHVHVTPSWPDPGPRAARDQASASTRASLSRSFKTPYSVLPMAMHAGKLRHFLAFTAASSSGIGTKMHKSDSRLRRRRHRPMVALTLRPMPCLERHRAEPGHDAGTARDRADHVRPRSPCTLADARRSCARVELWRELLMQWISVAIR